MKLAKKFFLFLIFAAAVPALAATKIVTLAIPSMTCPVCPITVKKALTAVPGVSDIKVIFAKREAIVAYDDAKTHVAALTKATADAGYPSTAQGQEKK